MGLLEKERWSQVPRSHILALVWISSLKSGWDSTSFIWFQIVHVHNKAEGAYGVWWNQNASAARLSGNHTTFPCGERSQDFMCTCVHRRMCMHTRGLVKHWPCLNKVCSWGSCESISFMILTVIYFDDEGYGSFRGRQQVVGRQG